MRSTRLVVLSVLASALLVACTALLGDFTVGSGPSTNDGGSSGSSGTSGSSGSSGSSGDGGGDAGVDSGIQCNLVTKLQRPIPADGGAVSAENMWVYSTTQSKAVGVVKGNNSSGGTAGASIAFDFRTDRLEDANVITLEGRAFQTTRARDDTGTYALWGRSIFASNSFELDLYHWVDTSGISSSIESFGSFTAAQQPGSGDVASTPAGVFYAYAVGGGGSSGPGTSYAVAAGNTPSQANGLAISNIGDTGLGDGGRFYVLRDGTVSLFVNKVNVTSGAVELHQLHFPANSNMPSLGDRVFPAGFVFGMTPHGTDSADVGIVVPTDDAGMNYAVYVGVIKESDLFTFDVTKLKALPTSVINIGATKPCLVTHEGQAALLSPNMTSGFDLFLIDMATASVRYSLTGANNLLHADANILSCAISSPRVTQMVTQYDVIWLDRSGASTTLQYAPLQCSSPK